MHLFRVEYNINKYHIRSYALMNKKYEEGENFF